MYYMMGTTILTRDKFSHLNILVREKYLKDTINYISAPCRSDEFECENGRCIDKSIECNGYNPCGDNSACRRLSVGDKFAIVLGVIVAILVTVGVILCVRRCKSNKVGSIIFVQTF